MDPSKAAEELKIIRQLMERPVRYSTQSGASGIVAGLAALGGCAADAFISGALPPRQAFWANLWVWSGVFLVAFVGVAALTHLRERRQGMPFWNAGKRRILMTILPPFLCGVGLTLAIAMRWYYGIGPNLWGLIPAIWMCFYGVACWQVGEFSIVELRVMGAAFVLSGVAAASLAPAELIAALGGDVTKEAYWTLAATFGGYHIVYGAVVWVRHGG